MASSVESSVVPTSAHYVDAPKDLNYHAVPPNGKVALVTGITGARKLASAQQSSIVPRNPAIGADS